MIDQERRSSRKVFLATLVLCLVASSCQMASSLGELSELRAGIMKQYSEPEVNVNLHNGIALTITFVNSPLNAMSVDERRKRAETTAAFVRQHYAQAGKIEEIWVSFIRVKSSYIIITYTEGLEHFGFDKQGRLIGSPVDDRMSVPDHGLKVIAKYLPKSDETEVLITSLQLEGNTDEGVVVLPHFTVRGDATGLRRSDQLPKSVSLDFACYSPKSLFRGATQIKFVADKKIVLNTSGEFSSTRGQDGLYSEFLMLQVSYAAFQLMTSGETLTFVLDDQEYELKREQLQALREMTKYVRD